MQAIKIRFNNVNFDLIAQIAKMPGFRGLGDNNGYILDDIIECYVHLDRKLLYLTMYIIDKCFPVPFAEAFNILELKFKIKWNISEPLEISYINNFEPRKLEIKHD